MDLPLGMKRITSCGKVTEAESEQEEEVRRNSTGKQLCIPQTKNVLKDKETDDINIDVSDMKISETLEDVLEER